MTPLRLSLAARIVTACFGALIAAAPAPVRAQDSTAAPARGGPARAARDPMQEGLPLKPERTLEFTTALGHWMSVDVSPDGQTLVFDLLGDLYTLPMAGGTATPLTRGMAFDGQPRFSPDGKKIVFVSDRDGGWNVWTMSLDKRDTTQLSRGKTNQYESPEWTPDGKYVVVTRNQKLHLFHADGGAGQQLIRVPATPGQPDVIRQLGAAVSPDGRWVWFAQRRGSWIYNTAMGDYQLVAYDRRTGQSAARATRYGSAFRPTLSPDGRWLAYGSRHVDTTRLRLRDLESGDERWLALNAQRDDLESRASLDVYPGMSFTPDSKFLVATWAGKLWKTPVAGGPAVEIPFQAPVRQALGPAVKFDYPIADSATFVVKQIRDAVPSPDGKRLAFVALDKLYVMDYPGGTPRRLGNVAGSEFEPAWSPDGRWIAYATWANADGGHLYKVRADGRGGAPERLTTRRALYRTPVWAPGGARVVAVRGPARALEESIEGNPGGAEDFVWVPASGGDATFIAPTGGLATPHFAQDTTRFFAYGPGRGLVSMRWDGTDVQTHVRVVGPPPPGPPPAGGPAQGPAASLVRMAPDGDQALAAVGNDVYVVTVPVLGGTEPTITAGAAAADAATFPVRRLTDIGGQFPAWSWDAKRVHWSIGNAHAVYDLDRARAFDDSVREATRARLAAATGADSARVGADSTRRPPTFRAAETRIRITAPRDVPRGAAVLRGARVVTMRGAEVIENADVVIRDNRIAAVGARGQVEVPNGARVIDVAGKTIVPGFVDTHAHVWASWGVHRDQLWMYAANLAYGVTTVRDPQTATTDVLTYEDQVKTGAVLGPRIYSTGPGVFGPASPTGQNFRDLDHARSVLRRYAEYYDTKTLKQYVAGNREQRQWVIQAARELRLMPTTEGSLDIKMNVTEALDGYSGHEHTIPTFPLQPDAVRLFAASGMVYTPTILVAYGGPWAENYYYATEDVLGDAKLRRFTPWAELEAKALRRGGSAGPTFTGAGAGWFHPSQHVFTKIGQQVRDLVAAGGQVGVGSHGQLQGLGYHWELWSMASGGLSNHDALRAATIMGADAIGLDGDLGSVEAGKLADLVVLDANPLENIRNTNTVRYVMMNGRLYEGATLDEVWPRATSRERFYWADMP